MVQVQQVEKTARRPRTRSQKSIVDLPEQVTEDHQLTENPLAELLSQAEKAYQLYLQAQREVAKGYKKHEWQMEMLFKDEEKRANDTYGKALAQAVRAREQAKQEAEEALRKAQVNAEEAFQRSMQEAQKARRESVEQAWQRYVESLEQAWGIFQGEKPVEIETDQP